MPKKPAKSYYTTAEGIEPAKQNPFLRAFLESGAVKEKMQIVKGKKGWVAKTLDLHDPVTGELTEAAVMLATRKVVDRANHIKIYVDGLQSMFELSKRGKCALTALLKMLNEENRCGQGDRNDMISFDLDDATKYGWAVSRGTFRAGMNELCLKKFLCPVSGGNDWYWTNPTFFHKGDRIVLVNHYIVEGSEEANKKPAIDVPCGDAKLDQLDFNGETERDKLLRGQS